jgi:hypothetical protein
LWRTDLSAIRLARISAKPLRELQTGAINLEHPEIVAFHLHAYSPKETDA